MKTKLGKLIYKVVQVLFIVNYCFKRCKKRRRSRLVM